MMGLTILFKNVRFLLPKYANSRGYGHVGLTVWYSGTIECEQLGKQW